MEAQAYLIGAAVVIISAILIYLIAAVTMREKSYDDILAEQRKRREDLFASTNQAEKSKKSTKKQKSKDAKKVQRERSDVTTDGNTSVDEVDQPQKMVELELEPEVIGDAPKPTKAAKGKRQKAILLNKQEKVVVRDTMTAPEAPHYRPTPKDAVALKQERERKDSETMAAAAETMIAEAAPEGNEKVRRREKKKREMEMMMQQEMTVENVQMTDAPPPTAKEQRRVKKAKDAQASTSGEYSKTDGVEVIATVQAARLNNADIQALIEVLLGKQGGSLETTDKTWKTKSPKGDPVEILERQLTEKNHALKEEQEQVQVAMRKLKEVQQELAREHHQYALLENESKDKMAAQLQDIQALQLRMQQTHEQHRGEVARLKMQVDQRQGQINDNQVVMMQRLKDENMQLQDKSKNVQTQLKIVQDELSKQIKERGSVDGTRKVMESKLMQYEDKIHKLESSQRDTENVLTQKYKEVSEHLQREQGKSSALVRDLDKANTERHHRDQELANMRNCIQDLENVKGHRDQELHDLQSHLQNIQEDNTTLITELKTYRERTSGEGQEAPSKPQGAAAPVMEEPKQEVNTLLRSEHDHILKAKDLEINQLKADLEARLAELSHLEPLSHEVETLKKKNNDMEVEKSKAMADTIAAGRNAAVANEQLDELKRQLQSKSGEFDKATASLEKTVASLESLTRDHDGLQRHVSVLEASSQSITAAAEEVSQLQLSLSSQAEVLVQKEELIKSQEENIKTCYLQSQSQTEQLQQYEKEVQSHKEQLNTKVELLESLNKQLQEKEELVQSHSQQLHEKELALKSSTDAQSTQDNDLKLKSDELNEKEAALKQLIDQLKTQESELEQQKLQLDQKSQQIQDQQQSLDSQTEQSKAQTTTLETQMKDRENSLEEKSQQLKAHESRLEQKLQELQENQRQLDHQQAQGQQEDQTRQSQSEALQSELDSLKKENEELREKNWKAMEAVSLAEKRAQGSSTAAGDLGEIKQSLQKLFPQVTMTESTIWLKDIEEEVRQLHSETSQQPQSQPDESDMESKLEESVQNSSRLEGQVQHYKAVLADTESILNKLQSSVESEEQKWIHKLHTTEANLKQANSENSRLSEEIQQLQSSTQLSEMEQKLSAAESENLDLHSQISESSISLNSIKADLEEYRHSSLSDNVQEAGNIKLELEDSLKKVKEMKTANVKLTGQLKIGQEALRLEQEEVEKLKKQVQTREKTLTNGSPVHHDVDEGASVESESNSV